ncbi:MAG: outer membrane protein assembly factor BamD [Saprospiraceae bacterium]|nr:MAG: outer membrane protein assembly factor BamD [Saprospiraceae bacterium]
MKTLSMILFSGVLLFSACQSDEGDNGKKLDKQISEAEQKMAAESKPTPEQLTQLIKLYEQHVEKYPERKETNVAFLMKAAEAARAKSDFKKALEIYDRVIAGFRGHEKAARALFMKGYTYDNDLVMKDSAVVFYKTFLQRYPRSEFADDAKFLLENIGKTNAEIIEEFEKKQKAQGGSSSLSGK